MEKLSSMAMELYLFNVQESRLYITNFEGYNPQYDIAIWGLHSVYRRRKRADGKEDAV